MKRRPALLLPIFIIAITLGLCTLAFIGFNYLLSLPDQAARLFGPPSPSLSSLQLYRLSAQLIFSQEDLLTPTDPAGPELDFSLELGESTASLIARLAEMGLVRDPDTFRGYLIYAGLDTQLQAGDYRLSPAMTPLQIAQALLDATPGIIEFSILPGWRTEEVAASLATSGLSITAEEFITTARSRPAGFSFSTESGEKTMEGYLFPFVYELPREIGVQNLLQRIAATFDAQVSDELRAGFETQGLSLDEAVILASILQREAVQLEEQPLIASVFLNRLSLGMKLEADPTVQYALGYDEEETTWWTNPLSLDDLKFDSPYNTYLYGGLPPGPIANPSLSALQAVAFPAQTPYYFFRAACDGSGWHLFAQSFEEHQANACP